MCQASRAFPLWAPPHKAGCPSSAPPPASTLHLQNTKHGNTCRNIAALITASTLSVPRNRLPGLCKGSWKADGNLDGQFSNLVMTKLTKLEVGNPPSRGQQLHLHLHLPPRNGQDRDRPLSDPPRIGLTARCRQQGGLEEWPNTAGTAPTNSLAPHDQRPNSDQKHGQCQTDFINRSPPPHLQPLGRRVWPCFAHRHWSSTHHRHHRPAAVRGGPSAPPEPNARVGRVPTALPATPPERTFSLFILAPFCADGLCHAAQCAPGS